jgi:phage-related tail protein
MARLGQLSHDLAADEAGAAEHRYQTLHLQPSSSAMMRGIDDRETVRNELRDLLIDAVKTFP